MTHSLISRLIVFFLTLPAMASVVIYEGFATDALGSGENYAENVEFNGVNKVRTGFTGAIVSDTGSNANVNQRAQAGSLNVVGANLGDDGAYRLERVGSSGSPIFEVERNFSYVTPATDDLYLSFRIRKTNGAVGEIFLNGPSNRDTVFRLDDSGFHADFPNNNGNFTISGSFNNDVNYAVFRFRDDHTGAPYTNSHYYDAYDFWWNPVINPAGTTPEEIFGTPDESDWALVREMGGAGEDTPYELVQFRGQVFSVSQSVEIDEFILATHTDDLVGGVTYAIPEPGTLPLLLGGALLLRRRLRHLRR